MNSPSLAHRRDLVVPRPVSTNLTGTGSTPAEKYEASDEIPTVEELAALLKVPKTRFTNGHGGAVREAEQARDVFLGKIGRLDQPRAGMSPAGHCALWLAKPPAHLRDLRGDDKDTSMATLGRLAGPSDRATTLGYMHPLEDSQQRVVEPLESRLSGTVGNFGPNEGLERGQPVRVN